jgi:hypothetical protein
MSNTNIARIPGVQMPSLKTGSYPLPRSSDIQIQAREFESGELRSLGWDHTGDLLAVGLAGWTTLGDVRLHGLILMYDLRNGMNTTTIECTDSIDAYRQIERYSQLAPLEYKSRTRDIILSRLALTLLKFEHSAAFKDVHCTAISHGLKFLATGHYSGHLRIWDLRNDVAMIAEYKAFHDSVWAVGWSADDGLLAARSDDSKGLCVLTANDRFSANRILLSDLSLSSMVDNPVDHTKAFGFPDHNFITIRDKLKFDSKLAKVYLLPGHHMFISYPLEIGDYHFVNTDRPDLIDWYEKGELVTDAARRSELFNLFYQPEIVRARMTNNLALYRHLVQRWHSGRQSAIDRLLLEEKRLLLSLGHRPGRKISDMVFAAFHP